MSHSDTKHASSFPSTEQTFKIVLLGGKAVGKTSLLYRYVSDTFSSHYTPTIGFDIKSFPVPKFGVPTSVASALATSSSGTPLPGAHGTSNAASSQNAASDRLNTSQSSVASSSTSSSQSGSSSRRTRPRRRSDRKKAKQRTALLQFWDVSHVELDSGAHLNLVFRDVDGMLLVCDGTRFETVENVDEWLSVIASRFPSLEIPILLLINKKDISDNLILPPTELDSYCEQAGFRGWRHTSAKTGGSAVRAVNDLFQMIINEKFMKASNPMLANSRDSTAGESVKSSRMVSVINQKLSSVPLFLWEHSVDYLSSSSYSPVNDKAHAHPFVATSRRRSRGGSSSTGSDGRTRSESHGFEPTVSAEEVLETCDGLMKRIDKYFDGVSDRLAAVDATKIAHFVAYAALGDSVAGGSATDTRTPEVANDASAPSPTQDVTSSAPPQEEGSTDKANAGSGRRATPADTGNGDSHVSSNLVPRLLQQCHAEKESFVHRLREVAHTVNENEDEKFDTSLDAVVTRVDLGADLRRLELDFQSQMCQWQDIFEQLRNLQALSMSVPPSSLPSKAQNEDVSQRESSNIVDSVRLSKSMPNQSVFVDD